MLKMSGGREVLLALRDPGDAIGETALLEEVPRTATVRAHLDSTLLAVHKDQFDGLLDTSPSAARSMLDTVLARWRAEESILRQSEKMAQLGELAAGVANDLNNPAAAVKRAPKQLRTAISGFEAASMKMSQLALSESQQETLELLAAKARERVPRPPELDALARSERESELEAWLQDRGIDEPWETAALLVNLEYDREGLSALAENFSPDQLVNVIAWLGSTYTIYGLLTEIGQGAGQISAIVGALRSYSYLDQAPVQEVDVHEGLDNTLIILANKLKAGISVRREYDPALPRIQAYGSELNQVWTNIIDNGVDALEGQGEITVRTRQEEKWVIVEIEDNGPGIPQEIRAKIFDPLFTTKPSGKGTGLGLNISYNTVVQKHGGNIQVFSQPGKTCFQVRLPTDLEAGQQSSS